tara:strand:- start:26 stop:571 length:546 start_codon:yes stop_codon:yes gene_type:complete
VSDNMTLWDSVNKTDPSHTKTVNQRGGFTAIDAHYQIQAATKQFGPVGIGWGYDCEYIFQGPVVICLVTLWHGDRINKFGPFAGCADMSSKRLDTDAPKKSMTDGLTKAISHLGFNADVFLGKFDDNKYVEEMKAEFAETVVYEVDDIATVWIDAVKADQSVLNQIKDVDYRAFIKEQAGV